MKHLLLFVTLIIFTGCSQQAVNRTDSAGEKPVVSATKKDDSTACAYWKCSTTKKLYMQKYVKDSGGNYRPAGAFKLDEGEGAFPLSDLDKYGSDGSAVSVNVGCSPCPYCGNGNLVGCRCGKTYCEKADATSGTCPWCGNSGQYRSGTWNTGGGG
ncbi:MAG: hypothetical protein LBT46_01115 [Planctomycetaceae bacterium]|jgi:hypothetical protein|nr:hypothetical protein [Planctomycetaceae bacterium]